MDLSKKKIIEALKDQQDIFGDDLFEEKIIENKSVKLPQQQKEYIKPEKKITAVKEPFQKSVQLFNDSKSDWEDAESLEQLNKMISNCTKCALHKGRTNFVFGSGNPDADVMVVGKDLVLKRTNKVYLLSEEPVSF